LPDIRIFEGTAPTAGSRAPRRRPPLFAWAAGASLLAGAYHWCATVLGDGLVALVFVLTMAVTMIGLLAPMFTHRKG
jgi:hypothetical protein